MKLESFRLLEGKSVMWDDITKHYKNQIYSDDYIVMYGYNEEKLSKLLSSRPFLSSTYVVEIHLTIIKPKMVKFLQKMMNCEWVCLILVVSTVDNYELLSTICPIGFNGYKIPENYWTKYVQRRMQYPTMLNFEKLYKLVKGRFELTDIMIEYINSKKGSTSVAAISRLLGKKDKMTVRLLFDAILIDGYVDRKYVFKFLEEYRYGYTFIHTALKKNMEKTLTLYKDFYEGKLTTRNLLEYKAQTKMPKWELEGYLEVFNNLSYDELLWIDEVLNTTPVKSPSDMFRMVGKLLARNDENNIA